MQKIKKGRKCNNLRIQAKEVYSLCRDEQGMKGKGLAVVNSMEIEEGHAPARQ